jgi:hypothetical protein
MYGLGIGWAGVDWIDGTGWTGLMGRGGRD